MLKARLGALYDSLSLSHPFLFAAAPVLGLQLNWCSIYDLEDCFPALIATEILVAIMFLTFFVLTRAAHTAANMASVFIALWFGFAPFQSRLNQTSQHFGGPALPDWLLLILYAFLLVVACLALDWKFKFGKHEFRFENKPFCHALFLIGLMMAGTNAALLAIYEDYVNTLIARYEPIFAKPFEHLQVKAGDQKPDIYYIIPDAFSHQDTLEEIFGYDNSAFIASLRKLGFYVVPQASSNYDRTVFSLPSSFNMQYIDEIPNGETRKFHCWPLNNALMRQSCVFKVFKKLGYKIVNVSSFVGPTDFIPMADVNITPVPWNIFSTYIVFQTPMLAIEQYTHILRSLLVTSRLWPFNHLQEIAQIPGPKFVVLHSTISHSPHLFDENGAVVRPLPVLMEFDAGQEADYLDQLKYAEKLLLQATTYLVSLPNKPVVIVQSDHGAYFGNENTHSSTRYMNQKMRILNAYFLPDMNHKGLYPTITPVNSFRVVLNNYFSAELPLLPDISYGGALGVEDYRYDDITKRLHFKVRETRSSVNPVATPK